MKIKSSDGAKNRKRKSGGLSEESDTSDEESCPSLKLSDSSEFEEDDVQSMGEKQKESGVGTEEILNVSESEYEKIRSKNIAERESFFENCVNPGMKDLKESLSKKKSKKVKRIYDLPKRVLTRNRSIAKQYENESSVSSVEGENPSKTSSLRGEEKVCKFCPQSMHSCSKCKINLCNFCVSDPELADDIDKRLCKACA